MEKDQTIQELRETVEVISIYYLRSWNLKSTSWKH